MPPSKDFRSAVIAKRKRQLPQQQFWPAQFDFDQPGRNDVTYALKNSQAGQSSMRGHLYMRLFIILFACLSFFVRPIWSQNTTPSADDVQKGHFLAHDLRGLPCRGARLTSSAYNETASTLIASIVREKNLTRSR
jgi:hypothetical protein